MMIFLETIKMVVKVFLSNKLRTFLTMLGIIVGIFSVTMIFAVSEGTKDKISKEFAEMDKTTISLTFSDKYDNNGQLQEKTTPPYDALLKLGKTSKVITNVTVSSPRTWKEAQDKRMQEALENGVDLNAPNQATDNDEGADQVNAIGYDFFRVKEKLSTKVTAGRLFTKFDEQNQAYFAVISDEIAAQNYGTPRAAIGHEIMINNNFYKIIGVLARNTDQRSGPWDDQYVFPAYILHSTPQNQAAGDTLNTDKEYPEEYILKVKATKNRDQAKQEITDVLSNYMQKDQYQINMGFGDNQEATDNIMDLITMVFAGIAGLSLIVGGIGIMNIMLVSVNERIKEIGIRQALGARRRHILMQFLVEAIAITLLAGMIGMIFAEVVTAWLNTQNLGIVLTINVKIMVAVTLFCTAVGVIFGYYPANKASKLNIADALRYE